MPFDDIDRMRKNQRDYEHQQMVRRMAERSDRGHGSTSWEDMGAFGVVVSIVGIIALLVIMASHR
jgi:hypothetical protein